MFSSRQIISHGHVKVNGKRVTVPSYRLEVGDIVELRDKAKDLAIVIEASQSTEREVPDYIEVDEGKKSAKLTRVPTLTEVPYPVQMEPNLVVEYYSR